LTQNDPNFDPKMTQTLAQTLTQTLAQTLTQTLAKTLTRTLAKNDPNFGPLFQRLLSTRPSRPDVVGVIAAVGQALPDRPAGRGHAAGARLSAAARLLPAAGEQWMDQFTKFSDSTSPKLKLVIKIESDSKIN
jgi:hypothetical protein